VGAQGGNRRIAKIGASDFVPIADVPANLGAPNDLIGDTNGGIYFTAPRSYLYYLPPRSNQPRLLDNSFMVPNGLTLTNDGKMLIVDDTRGDTVFAFDVQNDCSVKNK